MSATIKFVALLIYYIEFLLVILTSNNIKIVIDNSIKM